jgi:hypothetical protein
VDIKSSKNIDPDIFFLAGKESLKRRKLKNVLLGF